MDSPSYKAESKLAEGKPFSSAGNRSSKVIKTLGAELAGPKAMLVLGSNPHKDKKAMEKADRSLKTEMEKHRRRSTASAGSSHQRSSAEETDSPSGQTSE